MRYQDLNSYWDGLLALGRRFSKAEEARAQLIEEASSSDSLEDLVEQWVLVNDLGQPQLLQLKIWLQMSYSQLAQVFRCGQREIAQWLKAQRSLYLPAYPVGQPMTAEHADGLSCFMVEQYLSQWIDAEIFDVRTIQSLRQHLSDCSACQERLELYRQLQSKILSSRPSYQAISDQEWRETLNAHRRRERRWLVRLILYVAAIVLLALVGIVWVVLVPEKSPNIFELP